MARQASAEIADRNQELVAKAKMQLEEAKTVDFHGLAAEFGMTTVYVKAILKSNGVDVPKAQSGPRKLLLQEPISKLHFQIGRDITAYRIFQHGGNVTIVANLLKMSVTRLNQIERGSYDLTLKELQKVAEVLGKHLNELMTER